MKKIILPILALLLVGCGPTSNPPTSTDTPSEESTTTQTEPSTEISSDTHTSDTSIEPSIDPVVINEIKIIGDMLKKEYEEGESWDLNGLEVNFYYSDGSEAICYTLEGVLNDSCFEVTFSQDAPIQGLTNLIISLKFSENGINLQTERKITDLKVTGKKPPVLEGYNNYYKPEEYELSDTFPNTYHEFSKQYFYDYSFGDTTSKLNYLVVPIAFIDSTEDTSTVIDDLNKVFNGTSEDTGWESVSSYFEQCSYGNLEISFTVAPDWYQFNQNKRTMGTDEGEQTEKAVKGALEWYKDNYSTTAGKEFDADKNGYVDGIILIYSEHNYYTSRKNSYPNFWAYMYSTQNDNANVNDPQANVFIWASYDFMYAEFGGSKNLKLTPHTYIHEMGHMFGLDDYYDYNGQSSFAGGFDMQDENSGDHNPYSKFALGWSKPYVVYGDSQITLTPSSLNESQSILIPIGEYYNWNKTPFDEYILIDFYTPDGLNYFDTYKEYRDNIKRGLDDYGIRIYHIDSRLYSIGLFGDTYGYIGYADTYNADNYYVVAANNSTGGDYQTNIPEAQKYRLVHLLSASGTDRMANGNGISGSDLFKEGSKFSQSTFSSYFANGTKMNNGTALGFEVEISSLSRNEATITITKL
jgi:M6 family metalloprotease-like protein